VIPRKALIALFPVASLLNSFSMTALLLAIGLLGRVELAADVALVQAATLALFFAFSANARNVVLASRTNLGSDEANAFLLTRLVLLVPLAATSFFLAVGVGGASIPLAIVLILRRSSEWIAEICLARQEVLEDVRRTAIVVVAEMLSLTICLGMTLAGDVALAWSALPWALVPLLSVGRGFFLLRGKPPGFGTLLPHFGSSAIVGASVFVFRLSVSLLVGKTVAGTLFTAFAVGSLIPTVFGQALAPTLIRRFGHARLPREFALASLAMLAAGGLIAASSSWLANELSIIQKPPYFWLATGLSIAGGGVMAFATLLRTKLLHEKGGQDVFGPDLLANLLIATCVPFVFYVFGATSLAGLYLLSSFLNLGFLLGARRADGMPTKGRRNLLFGLGVLLIFPVFFQMNGGLFRDTTFIFDAQGDVTKLPLPLSIIAMFLGIAILGNYWQARRTLATLFFTALLFVLTSMLVVEGNTRQESAKLLLLGQFLLPMFGLVLGEMFALTDRKNDSFECAACLVMLAVLPLQLLASWRSGYTLLGPNVFFFSIYQHLLFFPVIVVALTIMTSVSLWNRSPANRYSVVILLAVSSVYVVSVHSLSAAIGFGAGMVAFGWFFRRASYRAPASSTALLPVLCLLAVFLVAKESGWLAAQLAPSGGMIDQESWKTILSPPQNSGVNERPTWITERIELWRFFSAATFDSLRNFMIGHAVPTDRSLHPSALNYWLDSAYNFGFLAMAPLLLLGLATMRAIWSARKRIAADASLFGLVLAVVYLLLFVNMLKVGMRQPYSGIITFFLWGLLIARLRTNGEDAVVTGKKPV
jgi:hypothetical protein